MKNTKHLSILFCLFAIISMMSCENAEIQKTTLKEEVSVTTRTEDCEDCPVEDCCCTVELLGGIQQGTIQLCGTSGSRLSTTACGPIIAELCVIEGYLLDIDLDLSNDPKGFFCAANGVPFCLTGPAGAQLRITCQEGATMPQFINVTLGTNRVYYSVDGECLLDDCL